MGVELRLLIGTVAESLRDFSPRLGFNYSVLVRDLQRIDRDDFVKWYHVERIALAAGVATEDEDWRALHALWRTASDRKKVCAAVAPLCDNNGPPGLTLRIFNS